MCPRSTDRGWVFLWGLSLISHIEQHDCILNKILFKKIAVFILWEEDATSAYKVVSSENEIILFRILFYISAVYRMKSNGPKSLP